ncbi:MAG TPA: hypothetical protein VF428_13835, partial [Casimicrobiaceae bacterium]
RRFDVLREWRQLVSKTRSRHRIGALVVVAPGLLGLPDDALARSTTLARLAGLATSPPVIEPRGIEAATVAAVGYGGAPTPLAALGAGLDPADQWVMHADPLQIEVGATDVVVAARVDDLDADDAHALAADISELIAYTGVRIAIARPDRWFALSAGDFAVDALPVEAIIGHGLRGELRRDDGARVLARMRGEIEMLLHEHRVNRARRNRGAATVDSLWLWGGGRMSAAPDELEACSADAHPGRSGDLARGLAIASGGRIVAPGDRDESPAATVVVTDPLGSEADLDAFGRGTLATALTRLQARRIDELVLVADSSGRAATWHARAPGAIRRLGLLVGGARFVRP